jgi:hypothetical protein
MTFWSSFAVLCCSSHASSVGGAPLQQLLLLLLTARGHMHNPARVRHLCAQVCLLHNSR